jgi:hypothetical protein
MRIPTSTKIERAGVVVSIASILAIAVGVLSVAPETSVWGSRTSSETFTHSAAWLDDCFHNPPGELPERPQSSTDGLVRISVKDTFALMKVCRTKLDKEYQYRSRTFIEYVSAYTHTVATTVVSPERLDISELLIGGTTYDGTTTDPHVGDSGFKVLKQILYWGVRFFLVGLFLLYVEPTLGRVLRFIWRGSPRV